MKQTPILHFHGEFRFHMPEYNNSPANQAIAFDPDMPKSDVMNLCGCDPTRYFEFEFVDVRVTQVTYRDGSQAASGDAIVGQPVRLAGMAPDVSASAICAQLFAARLRVGEALRGDVGTAVQSDLRLNVRPEGFTDETAAAHFDARVTVEGQSGLAGSRWSEELEDRDLELHFHVNRYTRLDNEQFPTEARLMGDVYGYLRPRGGASGDGGVRMNDRRLVAHPRLRENPELERIFLLETGGTPLIRITDIDGSYDLLVEDTLMTVRHLDFVPFLDRQYRTPPVDRYDVYFEGPQQQRLAVGSFTGRHDEMVQTGGLLVFPLPSRAVEGEGLRLAVDVVRGEELRQPLMIETDLDLILESSRALTMASGEAVAVSARVYRNNRPVAGHPVRLRTQPSNRRSPTVTSVDDGTVTTDGDGRVRVSVRALDLNKTGGVPDPVTGQTLDALPPDRYYGNYVYLVIDQPLRRANPPVEEVEIATRVVHRIDLANIPDTPSFDEHIRPLFSYYLRYFPWLHTVESGGRYVQFLDLSDHRSVSTRATEILSRLELDDSDRSHMPRSRDFPAGALELFQRWVDTGMQE